MSTSFQSYHVRYVQDVIRDSGLAKARTLACVQQYDGLLADALDDLAEQEVGR